jgi:mannose-1-phosphate guanylyltransferase/mannose-6-phosphate isomerase
MAKYDQDGDCPCGLYQTCVSNDFIEFIECKIVNEDLSMIRPWGSWHVLEKGEQYKVKRLEILPDCSISMQYHNHRSETWIITQGAGKVVLEGSVFSVKAGDTFVVPKKSIHKVTNTSNTILTAIEVQIGEITSEDDIVRV